MQVYLIYAAAAVALLALLAIVWRMARKRRAPVEPAGLEPEKARPDLKLVPPAREAEVAPPVEKPRALKEGLEKTRGGFIARLGGLLGKKQIDAALLDQLEEVLFTADIGTKTSAKLFEAVRAKLSRNELKDAEQIWSVIKKESEAILAGAQSSAAGIDLDRARPFVVLTIGVNGVGKTTTIGKLAAKWSAGGRKVLLAAGDTFRAAATEQLEIWGGRVGAPVVKGKEGGDPSSVIFDAIKRAEAEGYQVVIADTAGRLHTKTDLMEELQKVRRVIQKAMPGAPHETFLVLDA
ncbi:MAG TPA: signaling recognition particle receptor family protein, partial [Polyangia bacterium]|nr:signaling recognition particle receptor family protein [Polyangia bacterium]